MLDIGFMELLLIVVIALVVLGPERLPGAVRTTAFWVGKLRRSFQNAKDELERELNVDEIKRQIHNDAVMQELEKTKASIDATMQQTIQRTMQQTMDTTDSAPSQSEPSRVDEQPDRPEPEEDDNNKTQTP